MLLEEEKGNSNLHNTANVFLKVDAPAQYYLMV